MNYLKKEYYKMMCNVLSLSEDDLTDNERILIEHGFRLFNEKMEDIQILNDENRRILIELANMKSYFEDFDNERKSKLQTIFAEAYKITGRLIIILERSYPEDSVIFSSIFIILVCSILMSLTNLFSVFPVFPVVPLFSRILFTFLSVSRLVFICVVSFLIVLIIFLYVSSLCFC